MSPVSSGSPFAPLSHFPFPLQLLQQATSSSNLGAFSGIQQMAGESWTLPFLVTGFCLNWGRGGGEAGVRGQRKASGEKNKEQLAVLLTLASQKVVLLPLVFLTLIR